ncbi:hypothetical protein SLE2022_128180 [Rubroshorea leprosula]
MKNTITELYTVDGRKLTNLPEMEAEVVQFYQTLLGTEDAHCKRADNQWLTDLLHFQLPKDISNFLTQPVTEAEIKTVVFNSLENKAPGPDGYSVEFYKAS